MIMTNPKERERDESWRELQISEETERSIAEALERSRLLRAVWLWGSVAGFVLVPCIAITLSGINRESVLLIGIAWLVISVVLTLYFSYRRVGQNRKPRYEDNLFIGQDI